MDVYEAYFQIIYTRHVHIVGDVEPDEENAEHEAAGGTLPEYHRQDWHNQSKLQVDLQRECLLKAAFEWLHFGGK